MSDRISFAGKVETDGRRIRGSVVLKGSRTSRGGEYVEVDPAALVKADASDVFALLNHDETKVLGRTKNGTLSLTRTEDGISFETAELPNTQAANDALELARGNYFAGSSFRIEGIRSKFDTAEDGTRVRRITHIKRLIDVSPVYDPAFTNSSAAAFSKETDDVTEQAIPEVIPAPTVPPPSAEPPRVEFSKSGPTGKDHWAELAQGLDTTVIVGQMDAMFSAAEGDLRGDVLDRYEGFSEVLRDRKRSEASAKARIDNMRFEHQARLGLIPKAPEVSELFASDEYTEAFTRYLRTGDKVHMEQFAQSIAGDGTQGGYAVPDGFLNRVVETQKAYGGIARVADSITTADGQPLRWASNDDTANVASIAAEGSAGSTGADKILGEVTLGAFSYDATGASNLPLKVSKELLQDAAFDFGAFIARNLGTRIGRKMADDFATGSGSGEPKGLLDKTPDTMTATTMLAALIEHTFQVDAAYRDAGNCRWILSDTTLAKVYNSVDGNGRPLFIPQAQSGGSERPAGMLLGYAAVIDNGAGDLVAFGDLRQGYIIRYVRGVQVDVDPYTYISTRQVGYHAWARADANIQDAGAYSVSTYASVTADT